LPAIN